MKYDVHIYAIARVKVSGIEANSQQDAIKKAEAQTNLYETLGESGHGAEYAEEITGFLVDEVGDTDYQHSREYTVDGDGCIAALRPRGTRAKHNRAVAQECARRNAKVIAKKARKA